ncbi:MAG TPA: DNA polymerase/3'-5' exonuclease PolX [Acidimicrobiia bacterium]
MAGINGEVARLLYEYTDLLKLEEGSPQAFRVRAYERAAAAVRDAKVDVAGLSLAELQRIDGIGKSTAEKILEYVATGSMAGLEKLRAKYPPGFVELTRIPGVGPKTVLLLRDELGIDSVDRLRDAIEAGSLADLPRLGAKSQEKIAKAIERMGLHGKDRRTPIIQALGVALEIVAHLERLPAAKHVTYCGSLRRFRDTIGDVDILVAATSAAPVMDAFTSMPMARQVVAKGETKASILTAGDLQVDLRVVAPSEFGAATLYFTGSKEHNIALRQRAIERGWILNEYALADAETEEVVASKTEKAIYAALGLPLIAPELREGWGEIEAAEAGTLPRPVEEKDIRGDLHVHSTWSGDGRSSLEDMVAEAARRGLEYIAITEHGENLAINGLSRDEVRSEREVIAGLRRLHPQLTILHGAELNIGPDGSLDYDDEFLMEFDFCVASVHSAFDLSESEQTDRVLRAIAHPAVNVVGHLTGRRIGKRPGIEVDIEAVYGAASDTGTGLEINCHLDRLDVPSDLLRLARDRDDVTFVISTDSHHTKEFGNVAWGVRNARRGWVAKARIANTWPRDRFLRWVAAKRSR